MTPQTQNPETEPQPAELLQEEARRAEYRLQFARAWMQRKHDEQQQAVEEYQNNPEKRAVFDELDRRAAERGTRVVEYKTTGL